MCAFVVEFKRNGAYFNYFDHKGARLLTSSGVKVCLSKLWDAE